MIVLESVFQCDVAVSNNVELINQNGYVFTDNGFSPPCARQASSGRNQRQTSVQVNCDANFDVKDNKSSHQMQRSKTVHFSD